jgi:DNA-binding transcriptional MerR regulator
MPTTLTLPETVDLAQKVLDENGITPASKRAALSLTGRSVRWYSTAGIIDAPGREGHTATYGRRHLLQILYTREAQATGVPLEKIREDTSALSTEDLTARVGLDLSSIPSDLADVTPRKDSPFWERQPTDSPPLPRMLTASLVGSPVRSRRSVAALPEASVEYVVRVGAVSVTLDHDPTTAELASITTAARPLLSVLEPYPISTITSVTESGPAAPLFLSTTLTPRSI